MRKVLFSIALAFGFGCLCNAQDAIQYRRSSITKVLLPITTNDSNASNGIKDGYDAHNPETYDYNNLALDLSTVVKENQQNDDEYANVILASLNEQKAAHHIVLNWYGANEGAAPQIDLIEKRAMYDASSVSRELAAKTERGYSAILDGAATDLISHSFVMATSYNWLSGKDLIEVTKMTAEMAMNKLPNPLAVKAAQVALDKILATIDPNIFYVVTDSYLYRLDWNSELQNEFETKYWGKSNLNNETEFMNDTKYALVYVGHSSDKAAAFGQPDKAAAKATQRATDGCFVALQKANDVFKPLYQAVVGENGIESEVGMKDGIEGGEKFEVMNFSLNGDGTINMKAIGTISAIKGQVCDNRVYEDGKQPENDLKKTTFKGKAPKGQTSFMIRLK